MSRPGLKRSTSARANHIGFNNGTIWEAESDIEDGHNVRKTVSCLKIPQKSGRETAHDTSTLEGAIKTYQSMQQHMKAPQSVSVSQIQPGRNANQIQRKAQPHHYASGNSPRSSIQIVSTIPHQPGPNSYGQLSPRGQTTADPRASPRAGLRASPRASPNHRPDHHRGQYTVQNLPPHQNVVGVQQKDGFTAAYGENLDTRRSQSQSSNYPDPADSRRRSQPQSLNVAAPLKSSVKRNSSYNENFQDIVVPNSFVRSNSFSALDTQLPSLSPSPRSAARENGASSQIPKSCLKGSSHHSSGTKRKSSGSARPLVYLPPMALTDLSEIPKPAPSTVKITDSAIFGAQSSIRRKPCKIKDKKEKKANKKQERASIEKSEMDVKVNRKTSAKGGENLLTKPAFVQSLLGSPKMGSSPRSERGSKNTVLSGLPNLDGSVNLGINAKENGPTSKARVRKLNRTHSAGAKLRQYNAEQQRAAELDASTDSDVDDTKSQEDTEDESEVTVSLTMEEFLFENAAQVEKLEPKTQMSMEEFLCESRVGTQSVAGGIPC